MNSKKSLQLLRDDNIVMLEGITRAIILITILNEKTLGRCFLALMKGKRYPGPRRFFLPATSNALCDERQPQK